MYAKSPKNVVRTPTPPKSALMNSVRRAEKRQTYLPDNNPKAGFRKSVRELRPSARIIVWIVRNRITFTLLHRITQKRHLHCGIGTHHLSTSRRPVCFHRKLFIIIQKGYSHHTLHQETQRVCFRFSPNYRLTLTIDSLTNKRYLHPNPSQANANPVYHPPTIKNDWLLLNKPHFSMPMLLRRLIM
jgi:hypothetical protein